MICASASAAAPAECGARARLELADQVGVAVARRERIGEHVVQPVPEREHERQHHDHHQRGVQVHRSALGTHTQDQRHQRGRVEALQAAGRHLVRLVNDALDLARIEAGKLQLEQAPFDLGDVLAALTQAQAADQLAALEQGR